jgi:integrase
MTMTLRFTARTVARLTAPQGRRCDYFDAVVPGLALRVTPRGVKTWCVFYRAPVGGRLRRLTLGRAPVLSLAQARAQARAILARVHTGDDPAVTKAAARRAWTVADLADAYLTRYARPRKRSWRADQRLLSKEILPHWRTWPIREVTRQDVRRLVEAIVARGAPVLANRTAALLSKFFAFAVDDGLLEHNPAARIGRPAVERARDRVLTTDEIRQFWHALEREAPALRDRLRFQLLTAQRPGEVRDARWAEFDLEGGWWTIPAARSKNKLPHRVPLTPLALEILAARRAADPAAAPETFVFRGARGKRQDAAALRRMGIPDLRLHDLRRVAASHMASLGVSRLVIGRVLNHVERGVTAVYDRHSYDAEKRAALEAWARRLQAIVGERDEQAAIVPFAR